MKLLILIVALITLVSCGSSGLITRETLPSHCEKYVYLPFEKLTDESFCDELHNKYVRVDADFGYIFLYQDVKGHPSDQWIRLSVRKGSMRYDNIMVPRSESDGYFNLLQGEPITIYAKTTVWSSKSLQGEKSHDEIALNVTAIQRRISKEKNTFPDLTGWELIHFREQDGVEVKTYQHDREYITVYYEGGNPTGYWKAPAHGQNMTTYCDKDGDGAFETVLTNNPNCYYSGR